jgi:hypothetical protein
MEHAVSTVRRREFVTKIASALLYGQSRHPVFNDVTQADVKLAGSPTATARPKQASYTKQDTYRAGPWARHFEPPCGTSRSAGFSNWQSKAL